MWHCVRVEGDVLFIRYRSLHGVRINWPAISTLKHIDAGMSYDPITSSDSALKLDINLYL